MILDQDHAKFDRRSSNVWTLVVLYLWVSRSPIARTTTTIVVSARDVPYGDILQELILQAHTSVVFKGRWADLYTMCPDDTATVGSWAGVGLVN
jgi:predicted Ser/Thr protein kinase